MGKIIDVSRSIYPGMPLWTGDRDVKIITDMSIKEGAVCNLTSMEMCLHTGTHVDAPMHFYEDGADVLSLELDRFTGIVSVFDMAVNGCIRVSDIINLPINENDAVFFKTANSSIPEQSTFFENYIYLDASAGEYLAEKRVRTVGIDYLSVDGFKAEGYPVHKQLLANGIGIIEGLYLYGVKQGRYSFSCLPLRIAGVEGSPARAVLMEL